jgi:NAD(P)-dependent dehydrogenase (short-subunit alcohol dehydrogenase family)
VLTQQFAAQAPAALRDAAGEPVAQAMVLNMIDQRVFKLTPEFMTYTIAKMGLWALTRTAAQALAPDIRVNAIGPGPTLRGGRQSEKHFADQRSATILKRGEQFFLHTIEPFIAGHRSGLPNARITPGEIARRAACRRCWQGGYGGRSVNALHLRVLYA